jgi:hypothetical protein
MTPHLLDLEKCVPPEEENNLFVSVIPFYIIIYNNIPLLLLLLDCDYLATSYPWSMLWYMLFKDYTDVLSWHACRARHIVLALILDLDLISGHTITVLVLSTVLQVCNRYPPSVQLLLLLLYYYYTFAYYSPNYTILGCLRCMV